MHCSKQAIQIKIMDRAVNFGVYAGIVTAGAYSCLIGLHQHRAIVLGISLILFGVTFAWVDRKAGTKTDASGSVLKFPRRELR